MAAKHPARRISIRRKSILLGVALVAAALAAGASAVGLRYGSPTADKHGSWAPGNAGSVGAMSRLPAQSNAPDRVRAIVRRAAFVTGGDGAVAVASLRLLRSNLGVTHSDFYAFRPSAGHAVCYLVTDRGGACPTTASSSPPRVEWTIGGGYPAWSEHGYVAPDIDGIASDSVRSVTLASNGVDLPLEIVNNAFYKELDMPPDGAPWNLTLRVGYVDGSEKTVPVPDPRAD